MVLGILMVLLFPLVFIAVITAIITAVVKRAVTTNEAEEQANFTKTIRSIYVYLILICLLCAIIGGAILFFNSTINYLLPEENGYTSHMDRHNYTERERNTAIVGMFTASAILVSTVPLFIYHNRIARNELSRKK